MTIVTGAEVAAWLGLAPTEDAAEKYETVAAVAEEHIRSYCTIPTDDADAEVIPEALKLAGAMLAARLAKRAETPQGMGTLGTDAVFFVARTDPDLEALLSPFKAYSFG